MVEIAQDDLETLIHLTQRIFHGNLDLIKRDKGCSCRRGIGGFDWLGGDSFATWNENHCEAFARIACSLRRPKNQRSAFNKLETTNRKVIRVVAVSDPLLRAGDNPMFLVAAEDGLTPEPSHVTPCKSLANR